MKAKLKAGDEVRVDANYRVALEVLARPQSREHYLDDVPELPWEKVGGQDEALQAIRDAIELPLHPRRAVCKNFSMRRRRASCSTARPAAAKRSSARRPPTI